MFVSKQEIELQNTKEKWLKVRAKKSDWSQNKEDVGGQLLDPLIHYKKPTSSLSLSFLPSFPLESVFQDATQKKIVHDVIIKYPLDFSLSRINRTGT